MTKEGPKTIEGIQQEKTPRAQEEAKEHISETGPNIKPGYLEIMWEARGELPERMQRILGKIVPRKSPLSPEEQSYFEKTRNAWWKEKFGIDHSENPGKMRRTPKMKEESQNARFEQFKQAKEERMEHLSRSIQALDEGEPIREFNSEKRRTVFYDEEREDLYVVDVKGHKKTLGVGDILADYGWEIKYVPDGEMPHAIFRRLAKQILVSEARRDIEQFHDWGLYAAYGIRTVGSVVTEKQLEEISQNKKRDGEARGIVAERASREFLTRTSLNYPNLNFMVERSTALEDAEFKYDFKVRRKSRLRGVAVADKDMTDEEYTEYKKRIGVQLTINTRAPAGSKKARAIEPVRKEIKEKTRGRYRVDDIVYIHVPMPEILTYYRRWLDEGKPSGGPEQYFTPEIKKQIFLEATERLIKVGPETMKKIFPEEPNG